MGTRFTAAMQYDEESVRRLDQVITDTFHLWRRVLWLAVAVLLILYGAASGIGTMIGMLFLTAGCILLPAARKIPSRNGNRIIQVMRGKTLSFSYEFRERDLISHAAGADTAIAYADLLKLVKDERYYYLFQTRDQACMVDAGTLSPGDRKEFEKLLETGTGMEWSGPLSLSKLTLKTIIDRLHPGQSSRRKQ